MNILKKVEIRIIMCCLLAAIIPFGVMSNGVKAYAKEIEQSRWETKRYWSGDETENFEDNSVIVVMDKNLSEVNKKHQKNFFGRLGQVYIEDLTHINGDPDDLKYLNKESFRQILKINLSERSKENILKVIKKIEKIDGVKWVGPNSYFYPQAQPAASTGTLYEELWGLHGDYGIKAEEVWEITTGNRSTVRVGVMDTGIGDVVNGQVSHPDLNANIAYDNQGNLEGGNFVNMGIDNNESGDLITDPTGHGTHVAGIIGSTGELSHGIAGVAWDVQLVPLQVVDSDGQLSLDAGVRAITWAADNEIDIINCSLGGVAAESLYSNLFDAINNYTGLFVCAAGNNAIDTDTNYHFPSNFSNEENYNDVGSRAISVGAIKEDGAIAEFSNYGAQTVSLFAPGVDIVSIFRVHIVQGNKSNMLK